MQLQETGLPTCQIMGAAAITLARPLSIQDQLHISRCIGVASFGDCPLIRGKLVELNASTGAIEHTFYTRPRGCIGAGVWGSPTIDTADNAVYFATGNANPRSKNEPYSIAVVKLHATNLSYIDSWQVPANQQVSDGDFGSTPTLFRATIGGSMHNLVGVANKNGVYYALDRTNLHQGPVWQTKIADSIGGGCEHVDKAAFHPVPGMAQRSSWPAAIPSFTVTVVWEVCAPSILRMAASYGKIV